MAQRVKSKAAGRKPGAATQAGSKAKEAENTRDNILTVATHEFSEKGLSGARVDEIAERTNTSKRMIYYYFRSKEGLYRAVLERCYAQARQIDTSLDIDALPPEQALAELVRATFDYQNSHPDFVRIVMNENIHQGVHISRIASIKTRNRAVITVVQRLLERGVAAGRFRAGIDPVELHMLISALSFFNVSNRYTFASIFQRDMTSPAAVKAHREVVVDIIERWCATAPQRG
jgi:AcrR family transcriptional regulator